MLVPQSARVPSLDSQILCALDHSSNGFKLAQDEQLAKHVTIHAHPYFSLSISHGSGAWWPAEARRRTFHQGWRRSLGGTEGEGLDHGIDQPIAGETSSEIRQNACFDEEMSKADTAKHSSILETAVSRSTLDSEDSRQYRTLQCTAEQILDVPLPETMKQLVEMPEMVTQLGEVPNTVSQDRIKQRTVEHISEIPVPQVVEELAEISKVFSLDGVQQRFGGQIIETPALSLDEKIVEMPVTQKTQQVANTHVTRRQHS